MELDISSFGHFLSRHNNPILNLTFELQSVIEFGLSSQVSDHCDILSAIENARTGEPVRSYKPANGYEIDLIHF